MLAHLKYALIGGVILASVGLGIWQKDRVAEFMAYHHLLPEPEPLTELYFEDHLNLPTRTQIGKEQSFRFTINNLEYRDVEYKWLVRAISDIESRGSAVEGQKAGSIEANAQAEVKSQLKEEVINEGRVRLKHDEKYTTSQLFTLTGDWRRTKIEVVIAEKIPLTELRIARPFDRSQQSIHFWLAENAQEAEKRRS